MNHTSNQQVPIVPLSKIPTGIEGLDEITQGGLPDGRTTIIAGGPGTGKTVLALQTLVNGAILYNEPGIFVTFEESIDQIRANAATFGWDMGRLEQEKLFFVDARMTAQTIQSGEFELTGLLTSLAAKAAQMNAHRIVFDSIDVMLYLLNNEAAERLELYRLHEWLIDHNFTSILTVKSLHTDPTHTIRYGFLLYLVDCVITLNNTLTDRVGFRQLQILKYRGSGFAGNRFPLVFESYGIEIGGPGEPETDMIVLDERITTGVRPLDEMMEGGYYRGSNTLVSGSPGTAKSTLAGVFAQACCQRGERVVYFCFDDIARDVLRNFTSVNIHLRPFVESGLLKMVNAPSDTKSAAEHLLTMKQIISQHQAQVVVIDPISSMMLAGGDGTSLDSLHLLFRFTKNQGITLFLTSLVNASNPETEMTPIQVSTIADTWIHLTFVIKGGERNRAITIIKSRGCRHSNQVRELVLSHEGITLKNVYTSGGEVLMGTARWEKEQTDQRELEEGLRKLEDLEHQANLAQIETKAKIQILQNQVEAQEAEARSLKLQREKYRQDRVTKHQQFHDVRSGSIPGKEPI